MFRVAESEIAKGIGRHRQTVGLSLRRLEHDGFIDFVAPHQFNVEMGRGRPRMIDVSPLLPGAKPPMNAE
jgi:hypothetical protein